MGLGKRGEKGSGTWGGGRGALNSYMGKETYHGQTKKLGRGNQKRKGKTFVYVSNRASDYILTRTRTKEQVCRGEKLSHENCGD